MNNYDTYVIKRIEDFKRNVQRLYFNSSIDKNIYRVLLDDVDELLISKYELYYKIYEEGNIIEEKKKENINNN